MSQIESWLEVDELHTPLPDEEYGSHLNPARLAAFLERCNDEACDAAIATGSSSPSCTVAQQFLYDGAGALLLGRCPAP